MLNKIRKHIFIIRTLVFDAIVYRWLKFKIRANAGEALRLHLGNGNKYLKGWRNIDHGLHNFSDIYMDIRHLPECVAAGSVDEILMVHVISYLRFWEARDFFRAALVMLKPGGCMTLEFPEIGKIMKRLQGITELQSNEDQYAYMECLRAIYAFDMGQILAREKFKTYAFGWSAMHIRAELLEAGFSEVRVSAPHFHDVWRDIRIEAFK